MEKIQKRLTPKQAAELLGLSKKTGAQTLANWRYAGRGPNYHKIGRKVVYFENDLNSYVDKSRVVVDAE